jgi:hypothetical protein
MTTFNEGQTVIVTSPEKHQVGVIVKKFKVAKRTVYDVLLESRSAISCVNTAPSSKTYINRDLTKLLCESGRIETTLNYQYLVQHDLIPDTRL